MRRLLLTAILWLGFVAPALAICGGAGNLCNALPRGAPPQILGYNSSDIITAITLGGDCTLTATSNTTYSITCTSSSSGSSSLLSIQLNNAVSGTSTNKLVKLTGAPSTGTIMSTSDTSNALGVCISGCGNAPGIPIATVQILGITQCAFDGATTAGDAFTISTTVAGDCHDTGSVTPPGNPQQGLGYVFSTNAVAGTYAAFIDNVGILSAAVPPTNFLLANASSTGTTLNKLVKFTGAPSKGVITATTDTNNAIGICTSTCGTSGTAVIQYDGQASCVFDGATTAGDAFTISSTTAGDCHDTGSAIPPTATEPIGFVLSTNGGGGTYSVYFSTINGALAGSNFGAILVPNRVTTSSSSLSVNLATSINQFITLHDTLSTFTFTAPPPDGYVVRFKLTQSNGGSHTVTWPASVQWPGGSPPTLTTTNGQADFIQCLYDATTTNYDCSSVLNFTP